MQIIIIIIMYYVISTRVLTNQRRMKPRSIEWSLDAVALTLPRADLAEVIPDALIGEVAHRQRHRTADVGAFARLHEHVYLLYARYVSHAAHYVRCTSLYARCYFTYGYAKHALRNKVAGKKFAQ